MTGALSPVFMPDLARANGLSSPLLPGRRCTPFCSRLPVGAAVLLGGNIAVDRTPGVACVYLHRQDAGATCPPAECRCHIFTGKMPVPHAHR